MKLKRSGKFYIGFPYFNDVFLHITSSLHRVTSSFDLAKEYFVRP